ncbi:MAG: hypothetical protein P4L85_18475 [Paludisphaera borealis]|uniref:hypothetical protein n=1 Tax=Paludisphaera borealis TaxID=1387353 RepID=UPI00284576F8|nr:hypothetical protein [Paludisphaera borealis]MDR3621343.1 hypothetical protein [Paludisphaera borealis]
MKQTMRLDYAMELVVVMAFGMTVARGNFASNFWMWNSSSASAWLMASRMVHFVAGGALAGVALAGGVGLAVEILRRRSPAIWGWGRWTWSLEFFVALIVLAGGIEGVLLGLAADSGSSPAWDVIYAEHLKTWTYTFSNTILSVLAPFLITARLARLPADPSPDGREWAGRAFALASILWFVTDRAISLYWRT